MGRFRRVNVNQGFSLEHAVDRRGLCNHDRRNRGFMGPAGAKHQIGDNPIFRENGIVQFKARTLFRVRVKAADDFIFRNRGGVHRVKRNCQFARACGNRSVLQHFKNQAFALIEQVVICPSGVIPALPLCRAVVLYAHGFFQGFKGQKNLAVADRIVLFLYRLFVLCGVKDIDEHDGGNAIKLELRIDHFAKRVFLPIVAIPQSGNRFRVILNHDRLIDGAADGMNRGRSHHKSNAAISRNRGRKRRVNLSCRYTVIIVRHD